MTPFIQLWESRRVPERVMKLIPEYNGQDVIFIPENTNQKFSVSGEVQLEIPIQIDLVKGFNYTLSSGTLIIGTNLRVSLN
jgi:hypothetical protein